MKRTALDYRDSSANLMGILICAESHTGLRPGGLTSPCPADACQIKPKVLVCHGAADRLVPSTPPASSPPARLLSRGQRLDDQLAYDGGMIWRVHPTFDDLVEQWKR